MLPTPPNFHAIQAKLGRVVASVYRARPPEFPDPLDTTGSLLHGGRFNAPGLSSVLYTSLDPFTACLEFLDASPDDAVDRLLLYEISVRLEGVFDLRNPDVQAALGPMGSPETIAEADFVLDDRRLPAVVAAAAAAVGADGVVAPSAAWHRYADDPPGIQLDAARLDPTRFWRIAPPDGLLPFPATATWNLIILRDLERIQRPHERIYDGAAAFVWR